MAANRRSDRQKLINVNKIEDHEPGNNDWKSTLTLMVGSNAGAAVLGLPSATRNSGWSGIGVLLLCAIMTNYTAHLIGKIIKNGVNKANPSFSDIGFAAFGKIGKAVSNFSIYVTLFGVVILYFILIGQLLSGVFPCFSHGFFTVAIGVVIIPIVMFVKSMKEATWNSYFALSTTYVAAIIAMFLCLSYYLGPNYDNDSQVYQFKTDVILFPEITLGFSVYLFSLGAHPIFPSLYSELKDKSKWGLITNVGWIVVCALYFPVAIIGYFVFGTQLDGNDTILASLSRFLGTNGNVLIVVAELLFVFHFICAIPIFLTPCLLSFNVFLKDKGYNVSDKLTRVFVCLIIMFIALFFPYFTDIMSIISCLSVSLAAMILPALFYWKLSTPSPSILEKLWLIIIILFGVLASGVGIYSAVNDLIGNIKKHPLDNFFVDLFHINVTKCSV
jgi:vesicular inhibitory amino acid transporter